MPEVDLTSSTPEAWSASVYTQRRKALASSRVLPSKTYPAVLFRYDIKRTYLRSSAFDQVVILRVKSDFPFIRSGLAVSHSRKYSSVFLMRLRPSGHVSQSHCRPMSLRVEMVWKPFSTCNHSTPRMLCTHLQQNPSCQTALWFHVQFV